MSDFPVPYDIYGPGDFGDFGGGFGMDSGLMDPWSVDPSQYVPAQYDPWSGGGPGEWQDPGSNPTGLPAPGQNGGGMFGNLNMNDVIRMLGLAGGLGAAGLGAAGIGQAVANQGQPRTTTTFGSSQAAPMSPEQSWLMQGAGGGQGLAGLGGYAIGQNYPLMDQQSAILSELWGQRPQADPYLQQSLMQNAYGMTQGQLPALSPMLQQRLGDIYNAQALNIDRYLEDQRTNVTDRMNNMGWEGGFGNVMQQTPGQALYAPALREAVRQRGILGGQQAAQEIALAQSLPTQALQLGSGVLNQGLGVSQNAQGIAGGYNTPIATRAAIPQNLFNSMNVGRGTSSTQTQNAPGTTLLDAFAPTANVLGGLGGLLYGYANQGQRQPGLTG